MATAENLPQPSETRYCECGQPAFWSPGGHWYKVCKDCLAKLWDGFWKAMEEDDEDAGRGDVDAAGSQPVVRKPARRRKGSAKA